VGARQVPRALGRGGPRQVRPFLALLCQCSSTSHLGFCSGYPRESPTDRAPAVVLWASIGGYGSAGPLSRPAATLD
jgi:hypothetical protein